MPSSATSLDTSFETPEPISATVHVEAGAIRLVATDRTDTTVEVRPRDAGKDQDVRAAEQTDVSCMNGLLTVRTPKQRALFGRTGSVDVTVELPAGSRAELTGAWAQIRGEGPLGEVRVKTSAGDVRLDSTGPLHVTASAGSVSVERVEGNAEITTSNGSLRVGTVDGPAVLKNSHGTTSVAAALGDLRVRGANGDILVERAEGSVAATTAHGSVRIAEVVRGKAELETSYGSIEVGVRKGTAVWIDANSHAGQVVNALDAADGPEEADSTLELRARTRFGTVEIRRTRARA
ncbi:MULTISPECIES: DUF4097 family beta strand repeat-containing protein [Streptomyces]|uniref:DUF4097 domain-containing protein n=1 Tax=Streptomyces odorifer TaxID=53450 RepID=A0A7Y6F2F8_9ACTN|nr:MULTISPECIES: DUF4097 family beta strand repeat-containing protein [Streptomyces]NUV37989.1 DUF4097 domain-containing protein [Streptomyces sp. KAI-27]NUV50891.1 DUF4097 domain-containing protein [Streptomyces sp. CAI-78]MBL0778669.1 DUF4097 family beta strand repeat protein [Streptomyces albidoflavus]MCR0986576.1 DUF4097 domain-containing protein [Streptomyces albidoflavus]NUV29429.1 DUF4097 domain-containing protein [Streptomyces odorifer]